MTNNDTPQAGDVYWKVPSMLYHDTGQDVFIFIKRAGENFPIITALDNNGHLVFVSTMDFKIGIYKKIGINGKFDPNGEPKITFDKLEG